MMKKKLTKSNKNIVVSGTLAGIAEYFGIDPTIVRVIFVILTLMGIGSPVLIYIVLMVIIPRNTASSSSQYGHQNSYYTANNKEKAPRKDVTDSVKQSYKQDSSDDDWSDF